MTTSHASTGELPLLSREFENAQFGDIRLTNRLKRLCDAAAEHPGASFPAQASSEAALEATYRFFNNERVTPEEILKPHIACTVERATEAGLVLAVHDTTEFEIDPESSRDELGWLTPSRRGFLGHFAFGVSADGLRRPFGILGLTTVFRPAFTPSPVPSKVRRKHLGNGTDLNGESARWSELALEVKDRLGGQAEVIHVMDREADSYALFDSLLSENQRFIVRAKHDRVILQMELPNGKSTLFATMEKAHGIVERQVSLSKRKTGSRAPKSLRTHPPREERMARLLFSATTATIKRPAERSSKLASELSLNFVRVWEPEPPDGEEPIEWRLVTTEPIDTPEMILAIVDWYRARWVIEEFFKALKTGCAYQKRQMESRHAMLNALALLAPVAWRLLLLRTLARTDTKASASEVLTETQLEILKAVNKRLNLKVKLSRQPTVGQAMLAIAALGGHIRHNGPPGWLVLGRGLDKLLLIELGWRSHADQGHL